jgi:hypothetical protein
VQQNAATAEISQNVTGAAKGAKLVVSVLGDVSGAASDTRASAQSVLSASQAVERRPPNCVTKWKASSPAWRPDQATRLDSQ